MKVVSSYIFRAICAILVGILLVANPERMTELLVQIIGALFGISGIVSIVNYFIITFSEKAILKPAFPIIGLGSFLFGVFLAVFPGYFITYLMFVLGGLLILAAVNQFWNIVRLRKTMPFSWVSFVLALIVLGIGVLVVLKPMASASLPFILLGCNSIVYGISEMINAIRWRGYSRNHRVGVKPYRD